MTNANYIFAAVAMGVCLSMQPPINAAMSRILVSPLLAATVSIAFSFVLVLLAWLTVGKGAGDWAQVASLPWWVYIGGVIGVVFVAGSIVVAPHVGIALFFACVVAGQLLGSVFVDQFGAFGMEVKPVGLMKLIGLGLVLVGAALVQYGNAQGVA